MVIIIFCFCSSLHDIKRSDSGEKLTAVTSSVCCPCRRCFSLKFLVLQMMIVRSAELVASHFESGLNAQHKTLPSCPISACWWAPTNGFLDEDPPMFTLSHSRQHPRHESTNQPHPYFLSMRECTSCTYMRACKVLVAAIVTRSAVLINTEIKKSFNGDAELPSQSLP